MQCDTKQVHFHSCDGHQELYVWRNTRNAGACSRRFGGGISEIPTFNTSAARVSSITGTQPSGVALSPGVWKKSLRQALIRCARQSSAHESMALLPGSGDGFHFQDFSAHFGGSNLRRIISNMLHRLVFSCLLVRGDDGDRLFRNRAATQSYGEGFW